MVWEHDILRKHAPEWSTITKVQGGGTATSLKDKLYGKKFRLRLVSLDISTELPATSLLSREQNGHISPARRDSPVRATNPFAWAPQAPPEPFVPFGSPRNDRPDSWDVPDSTATNAVEGAAVERRTSARRTDDERHPEYRSV